MSKDKLFLFIHRLPLHSVTVVKRSDNGFCSCSASVSLPSTLTVPTQSHSQTRLPSLALLCFFPRFLPSSLTAFSRSYVLLWHLEIRHQGDLDLQALPGLAESWWLLYPRLTLHLKPTCSLLVTLEGQVLCTSVHASSGDSWPPKSSLWMCLSCDKVTASDTLVRAFKVTICWWRTGENSIKVRPTLTSVKQLAHQKWIFSKKAVILGDGVGGKKGKGTMI